MLCHHCLVEAITKLHPADITLLEYLSEQGANTPQFSVKSDTIRGDTNLTAHEAYTAILRLECFDMIGIQKWGRSNKHYIMEAGYEALMLLQAKTNKEA